MPELPDLLYISRILNERVCGRTVTFVIIKEPIVLRNTLDVPLSSALEGRVIRNCAVRGPFLLFRFSGERELIINLMLAGRLQHQRSAEKPEGYLCFSLALDDGSRLNLCDEQKMAKAYLVRAGDYSLVPKFTTPGVDILSPGFTREAFRALSARHTRKQVRVFVNDHTILSAIGNAYADEILFDARIHPKTLVARLSDGDLDALHDSIVRIIAWGAKMVEEAGQPIQVKVRGHMRVRNRKGEACVRCGTKIRREGVRGYDVFFCPTCQPPTRKLFIDWRSKPDGEPEPKKT
jgi:formamidopyrimidine-DNA glycosylase